MLKMKHEKCRIEKLLVESIEQKELSLKRLGKDSGQNLKFKNIESIRRFRFRHFGPNRKHRIKKFQKQNVSYFQTFVPKTLISK